MSMKRFAGPAALGASATKYTVPAGLRATIRHIHVSNTSAGAITFTASIGADAAGTRIFDTYSIAAGTVLDHYCLYVMEAAEIFVAAGGAAGVLTLSGELEAI